MKVRMLTGLSGAYGSWAAGEIYDCDDAEAHRLVLRGFAEWLRDMPVETAVASPAAETTAKRTTRRKRAK